MPSHTDDEYYSKKDKALQDDPEKISNDDFLNDLDLTPREESNEEVLAAIDKMMKQFADESGE